MTTTAVRTERSHTTLCAVCGRGFPLTQLTAAPTVRHTIAEAIKHDHPQWADSSYICTADLTHYRLGYVRNILETEKGEISTLEQNVLDNLKKGDFLSANINHEDNQRTTFADRLSDKLASFGGSWKFILTSLGLLSIWIAINALALFNRRFDPYPFILLNLVLSSLAALQAPIIMMSQNRQEARDRIRAENDYRVNLKAELEIRLLTERIDHLIAQQWQRLLEIQEIQLEAMEHVRSLPKQPKAHHSNGTHGAGAVPVGRSVAPASSERKD